MKRISIATALVFCSCVQARTPPDLTKQAELVYGGKVYLADHTFEGQPSNSECTRFAKAPPSPATVVLLTELEPADDIHKPNGDISPVFARTPHNCFVKVEMGRLHVDQVEVTNDLFQVCVDSGVCESPDPSKASKGQDCEKEDLFETCPVVEVTQSQANNFCKFIGRRLPSSIEHIVMRLGLNALDPTMLPIYPNGKRTEEEAPSSCGDAVIEAAGCKRPFPVVAGMEPEGAAERDFVVATSGKIFDLTGNASEWSADLMPASRGAANGLPWFCSGARIDLSQSTACPDDQVCVFATFKPDVVNLPFGEYPVCVAFGTELRARAGVEGALFGGSFDDTKDRNRIGVFARRVERNPDATPSKTYGFRCVGDITLDPEKKAEFDAIVGIPE